MSATPVKILVVDDDDLLRDFYCRVLKTEGYEPVTAINGDDAIEILDREPELRLAVIDLLMPIRTGWELIEFIKRHPRYGTLPIVAITGLAASFDEFEKVRQICDAVLHKSDFELNAFLRIVENLVKRQP
jgi:CheY-like chemotaxis protein